MLVGAPSGNPSTSSSSSLISSALHSHVTLYLERSDKTKLSNLLLPRTTAGQMLAGAPSGTSQRESESERANPKPCTPNHKPQKLNPEPQTPISKPQTPNPEPQTLNPKPYTFNPNPQTPNPKPQSPHPTPHPTPHTPNPKPHTPTPHPKPKTRYETTTLAVLLRELELVVVPESDVLLLNEVSYPRCPAEWGESHVTT